MIRDGDHPFVLGAQADARHAAVRAWFRTEPGRRLLEAECGAVSDRLANLFGYHLLQVGQVPGVDLLATSRTLQRCLIDLDGRAQDWPYAVLRGRAAALPVESDGVDVVVLPHVLEFEPRPHEALREAARVLVPDGHLLVSVLNPWSLLGVWRAVLRRTRGAPWNGRFLAQGRLRDWIALLGLELRSVDGFFFRPPLAGARTLDRLAVLERVGRRLWPPFCGAYLLCARKRVARTAPTRLRFAYRPRLVGVSLAGPPARVSNGE